MEFKEFNVSGMSCQHCAAKIKNALEGLDGVNSVTVLQQEQMVRIEAENMPTLSKLNEVLEEKGHYQLSV
jgi:copper chaperone CopZ